MKRFFAFITCITIALYAIGLNATKVVVKGDLNRYVYAYVVPTSGVTSNSGGGGYVFGNQYGVFGASSQGSTKTVNPAETISGQLMRMEYTILPQISPEFQENTMIVSYGYLEGEKGSEFTSASSTIMLQFRDAKTQELVASYETTGYGGNEAESIADALTRAINLFKYTLDPKIYLEFQNVYKKHFYLEMTNKTPYVVKHVDLRVSYYLDSELVHEQEVHIKTRMATNETVQADIKRAPEAQSRKMRIKVDVVGYK